MTLRFQERGTDRVLRVNIDFESGQRLMERLSGTFVTFAVAYKGQADQIAALEDRLQRVDEAMRDEAY